MRKLTTLIILLVAIFAPANAAEPVTVFAAASLKGALSELSDLWTKQGHAVLRVSFESSGTLAKQIQQEAPAQLFISADEKWMDFLQNLHLLVEGSRRDLLINSLVLIAPARDAARVNLGPNTDLAKLLGPGGRLAVGDPDTVPAGIYAKQALIHLGLWTQVQDRLAPAANVRAALLLVEAGEAPAGVVYATDALADPRVQTIAEFGPETHDRIVYPIALIKNRGAPSEAAQVLAFLTGTRARAVFAKFGFHNP